MAVALQLMLVCCTEVRKMEKIICQYHPESISVIPTW